MAATIQTIARRFTIAATEERRKDCNALLDEGVRWLQACKDVGMKPEFIHDTAKGLHDQLSNLMAAIDRDLGEVGLQPAPPLCVGELEGLFPLPRWLVGRREDL